MKTGGMGMIFRNDFKTSEMEEIMTTVSPTGQNLLDPASREKLPELYSGENKGLDAIALVKFFTLT